MTTKQEAVIARTILTVLAVATIILATPGRVRAATPTAQIISPACPAWAEVSKPLEFVVRGIDADNDLSRCDMYVDGVRVVWTNYFSSPNSGTTCTFNWVFDTLGTHTVSFQVVDKNNNFSSGARCTVEVLPAIVDQKFTVLTYNTHLFENSPLECIVTAGYWASLITGQPITWAEYAYLETERHAAIAAKIQSSGADIVALQEVWAYSWRDWMTITLSGTYPHAYTVDSSINCYSGIEYYNSALPSAITALSYACLPPVWGDDWDRRHNTLGNGLILLSKYPLSDMGFQRFPTHKQSTLDKADDSDVWADKGVLTATADVRGTPVRIGISHALCRWDDYYGEWEYYSPDTITTFQMDGEPYIFALLTNNLGHISRFVDYSYFDETTQTTKHGAGWKHVYTNWMDCVAAISFELEGRVYIFSVNNHNNADIRQINEDPSTGWTLIHSNTPLGVLPSHVGAFKAGGYPHLFVLSSAGMASILRINNDPRTGWTTLHTNAWGSSPRAITSFEFNGQPYLLEAYGVTEARITRLDIDPGDPTTAIGWTHLYTNAWGSNDDVLSAFELNGRVYVFGSEYGYNYGQARLTSLDIDPPASIGWTHVFTKSVKPEYGSLVAFKLFEMGGHPYLFALGSCCGGSPDITLARPMPGAAFLMRINDDGQGWEDLIQMEDIKMIRDATVVGADGPPAIMMGDFNVQRGTNGIMNAIFKQAGAVDAYLEVHGTGEGGETVNSTNNLFALHFAKTNLNSERIDYVYVKQSGQGVWLDPINAHVVRDWKLLEPEGMDLSDHYPLSVEFRLQEAARLEARQITGGLWQLSITGTIGRNCQVQCSPDLREWETLAEFRLASSPHLYTDPTPGGAAARFYRLLLIPD